MRVPCRQLALGVLVFGGLALGPSAAAQSVGARLDDLRLASAVRLALVADAATRGLEVSVAARDGAVALAGRGASDPRAHDVARAVPGVRSVSAGGPLRPEPTVEPVDPDDLSADPDDEATLAPPEPARPDPPRAELPRGESQGADSQGARPADLGPAVHVVARGETLFSLARRYGVGVEALRALNGIPEHGGIRVGQRLRLR